MNNLVRWNTNFTTTVFSNSEILTNVVDLEIYFSCRTDDVVIQNIGFERIKFLVNELGNGCLLMNKKYKHFKLFSKSFDNNIITLPTEPDDQVLLWCLYKKIDKILENNFILAELRLSSLMGEDVQYSYDGETNGIEALDDKWEYEKTQFDFWWNRSDTATYDIISDTVKKTIYTGKVNWQELNLDWQTEEEFMKGIKNNKQQAKIIKPKKFQIKVLDGRNEG